MTVAKQTGDKGKCDTLFSKIIRARGACERCDYTCPSACQPSRGIHRRPCKLQCAHIISRTYSGTRCDPDNAYALCAGCHRYTTLWPLEFYRFVVDTRGIETYDALKQIALAKTKINWTDTLYGLEQLASAVFGA